MDGAARYLSFQITPEQEGRTVGHLLKTQFHMAAGYVSSLKWRPDGILLDGCAVHTDRRVRAGETLSARIDDAEKGNSA